MVAGIEKGSASDTISVRISKYFLQRLRVEAAEKEISLNTLVNQIVKHHIYWHSVAPKAGFIQVRRRLINRVFERFSEQDVVELARDVSKNKTKDLLLLVGHTPSPTGVFEMIEAWVKASGFTYRRQIHGNKIGLAVEHEMGRKWSLYHLEIFRSIFEEFNLKSRFDLTDNTLRFEIEVE